VPFDRTLAGEARELLLDAVGTTLPRLNRRRTPAPLDQGDADVQRHPVENADADGRARLVAGLRAGNPLAHDHRIGRLPVTTINRRQCAVHDVFLLIAMGLPGKRARQGTLTRWRMSPPGDGTGSRLRPLGESSIDGDGEAHGDHASRGFEYVTTELDRWRKLLTDQAGTTQTKADGELHSYERGVVECAVIACIWSCCCNHWSASFQV
jgi:hypothetical protein